MKPLLRYTIGRVSKSGWAILHESIRHIRKVYPEFDLAICHNKLSSEEIASLEQYETILVRQDDLPKPFDFYDHDEGKTRNFCWKLIPPRLRQDSHELWVDNDILLRDRIEKLDCWLSSNTAIIGTGFNPDYGQFTDMVNGDAVYCAGFFGLPPNFDFAKVLANVCCNKKLSGFDEQGLVSHIVTNVPDFITLQQNDLLLLSEHWAPKGFNRYYPNGLHFARANRFDWHKSWVYYKNMTSC